MIAYSCNISCAGCISISDVKRSGIEPFDLLVASIAKWNTVIVPEVVTIFGGEPCLHPQLQDLCKEIRVAWPNSIIRLITNGYLLDNFDSSKWFDFAPFEFQVSVHRKDHEPTINKKIKNIIQNRHPWIVSTQGGDSEHRQITWSHGDFSIYKSVFSEFVVPYKKIKNQYLPWNSDPAQAHKICGSPATPILYKGLLYKCPPVANIIDITGDNWFDYHAVDVHDDIKKFVKNIGQAESVCGQCPDKSQAVIINHFNKENVIVRHKNIS
jgi:MoaA/NifB/PqqE/SkfB family radical SAM enzyme